LFNQIAASMLKGAALFLYAYSWLIALQAALTIFERPNSQKFRFSKFLNSISEPVNNPFRKLLRRWGASRMPVDLSPMLSLIALWALSRLLNKIAESFLSFSY
jgi:uncharacterized protein YggT (Ycf19 family)